MQLVGTPEADYLILYWGGCRWCVLLPVWDRSAVVEGIRSFIVIPQPLVLVLRRSATMSLARSQCQSIRTMIQSSKHTRRDPKLRRKSGSTPYRQRSSTVPCRRARPSRRQCRCSNQPQGQSYRLRCHSQGAGSPYENDRQYEGRAREYAEGGPSCTYAKRV